MNRSTILFIFFLLSLSLGSLESNAKSSFSTSACEIWDVIAEAQDCNDLDSFYVQLDFNYEMVGDLGFTVMGNGNNYGTFPYSSLPINLGPFDGDCETTREFVVEDIQFPDCSDFAILGPICCPAECIISGIVVETIECTGVDQYSIIFDFDYQNVSGVGFDVYTQNDVFIGYFLYENLPITISDFPASGNPTDWILICDNDSETCCQDLWFDALECGSGGNCHIYDMVVETHECDESGMFLIDIDFQFDNVGDNGFQVLGNGTDYGIFSYDSLFITLGPLDGDCSTDWEFVVKDVDFPECSDFVELGEVCCEGACDIFEMVAVPIECTGDNLYSLVIDFEYENVTGDGFDVFGPGGVFIGYYLYENLPITILEFPASGNDYDWLNVCDNDNESCCQAIEFMALDCDEGNCNIWDLIVEAYECNEEDQFYVDLDFNFEHVGENGFMVLGNGNNYGTFSYDSLYITLGPFEGDCETGYEFIVVDVDFPECSEEFGLGEVCCSGECNIYDLVVDPVECTGNNTYDLYVNFEYSNVNGSGFDVYGPGNVYIGYYLYDDLPVLINDFPSSGNTYDWLKVCDSDSEICCEDIEFMALDCGEGSCEIWDLVAEAHECNEEGFFYVDIDFNYANVGENGFTVHGNGNDYGTFSYDSLFISIGPLEGDCETNFEFVIQDVDFPDCSAAVGIGEVCCGEECNIYNLSVETLECTGDNQYAIIIDFDYDNVNADNFHLYGPGWEFIGVYAYDDLPVTITEFPSSGNDYDWLAVCDGESESCCEDIEFMALDCDMEGCELWDFIVEAHDCNDLDQFYVDLDFKFENVGENGFKVYVNDDYYGTYSYDSLYLTLGLFEANCDIDLIFTIQDVDFPDCQLSYNLGKVCCGEECQIYELNVDPVECTGVDQYALYLNFEYQNVNSTLFDVYGPGNVYIGSYLYADLPVLISDFPSSGNDYDWLKVCDSDSETCCKVIEFMALDCPGEECHIYDLVVDLGDCTGENMYSLHIDFEYDNVSSASFDVYTAGNISFGPFLYTDLPIQIIDFPASGNDYDWLIVCDHESEECCEGIEFEALNCSEECNIGEIMMDVVNALAIVLTPYL